MITLDSITQQRRSCRFCRISFFLICVAAFFLTAQIAAAESSEITFLKKLEAYDIADISSYPNDALARDRIWDHQIFSMDGRFSLFWLATGF